MPHQYRRLRGKVERLRRTPGNFPYRCGLFRVDRRRGPVERCGAQPEQELRRLLPAGFPGWSDLARDQYIEVQTLLTGYLLSSQGDRVSMAHSVEGRVPYLDHRVIEFANALSPRYKLRALHEKVLLRRALGRALPQAIVQRVKQPYRAPDSRCFFRDGAALPYVRELTSPANVRRSEAGVCG